MSKEKLRILMGENIRNERMARNMSIDELAEILELTPGFVGLIERGQRGATPNTLLKLSDIFGMSIDSMFAMGNESLKESGRTPTQVKRKKIASLVVGFSEAELDFIIKTVKALRVLSNPQVEDDDEEDEE